LPNYETVQYGERENHVEPEQQQMPRFKKLMRPLKKKDK
jgi:hypothetical protein